MNNSIDQVALAKAKELYMQYTPVVDIAKKTDIKRSTVQYYVCNYWKAERLLNKTDLMAALLEGKEDTLSKITDFSLRALERAMREVATRDTPPSVMEGRNIVLIMEKIDQFLKSENGEEKEPKMSEAQAKKAIEEDPFNIN